MVPAFAALSLPTAECAGVGERFVLVHGQLLDQERVDGRQNGCRGQLILGQVAWQQLGAVRSLIWLVGGVAHVDRATQ